MKILNKPISEFSFQDIVSFQKESVIEGTQIEYKKEFPPKGLAKSIAAMSNTTGGIIIIGIEEGPTGLPIASDGVLNEGKLVERVHQNAANVEPLPNYEVYPTDDENGKIFLLIRVYEGDKTPYYVQNNPNIWRRTGNISDQIDIAHPDYVELLFGKREKAHHARTFWAERASEVFNAANFRGSGVVQDKKVFKYAKRLPNFQLILQPHYPVRPLLAELSELDTITRNIKSSFRYLSFPPVDSYETIPDGLLLCKYDRECVQFYANGLMFWSQEPFIVSNPKNTISLTHPIYSILAFLESANLFYQKLGYRGNLELTIEYDSLPPETIIESMGSRFTDPTNTSFLSSYLFTEELSTLTIREKADRKNFMNAIIKKIHWAFGLQIYDSQVLDTYFST